jgi:hypothetical protein
MGKPAEETAPQETVETKTFYQVTEALSQGKIVRRQSWPEGTFVFRQTPTTVPTDVIPRMTSLPDAVKEEFTRRDAVLKYDNQFAKVDAENNICGYQVSADEVLAEDWIIQE